MASGTLHCGATQQAQISFDKLHGERGAASHLLRVDFQIALYAGTADAGQLIDLVGDLHAGHPGDGTFLANSARASGLPLDFRHAHGSTGCSLTFDLTPRALATVETRRAGQDLDLGIFLAGTASDGARLVRQHLLLQPRVPASSWCDRLAEMGYSDFLLFEVPLRSTIDDPRVRRMLDHLAKASRQLREGRWDECVSACRLAVEAAETLHAHLPATAGDEHARLAKVFSSLKHCFSVAHHAELHAVTAFDRQAALSALMLASGCCTPFANAAAVRESDAGYDRRPNSSAVQESPHASE